MSHDDLKQAFNEWKHEFRIGIFGSFAENNYPILEQTNAELQGAGYNSRLSNDLEKGPGPGKIGIDSIPE